MNLIFILLFNLMHERFSCPVSQSQFRNLHTITVLPFTTVYFRSEVLACTLYFKCTTLYYTSFKNIIINNNNNRNKTKVAKYNIM